MGFTLCDDESDKLDEACPLFKMSISFSLRPFRGEVVLSLWDVAMLTVTKQ